ncbi:mucin-5AC-like [Ambystoma mexicanum]|uniref:mucin-5AC-like n=1 Tax=Ambystoma mexicanum TaxID=8296 RepID=UPI0037E900AC
MSSTPANTKFTTTTNLPAASTTISPPRYISTRSTLAVTTPVTIAISSSVSTHSPCVYVHKVCKWSEWYDKTNPTEHPGDYETSDELRKKGIPVCKTPIDVECKAKKYPYAAVGDLGQTIQCNTSGFRCSNKDQNPPGCFIYKARYLCCSYEPCTEPLAADCILAQKTEFYTYWFEPPNQTDVPGEMERMPYITAEGNQDCTTPKKVECRPVENPDTPMNEMAPKMTCDESNGPQCYTNDHEKTPCRNYQVRFSCYTYNFSSCQTWQPSTSTRTTTSTSISSSAPAVHTASSRTTSTQSSASSTTSAPSTRMSSTPANTKFTTTTNLPAASTTISPPRYISTRSTLAVTTPVTIAISSSVSTHSPCVYVHKVCKWSEWYDKTTPTEHPGDYETSDELRKKGIPVCKTPIDVECKAKKYPYATVGDLGQTIQCNTSGFRCSNKDQNPPGCFIYKARYLCCSYEPCTEPLAADCILAQKTEFYTYWFEPPNQTDVPGEMERMPYITAEGNQDCTTPKKVECRPVENPDTPMNEMAPKMTCDESNGPQCYTNDHEKTPCRNYQVRFSCYTYNFSSCQTWQPSTSTRTTTSTSISSSAPAVHTASSRTTSTQSSASSTTSAPSTRMSSTPANTKFTTTTNLPAASTTISPPRYISTRSTLAVTTPVTIAISSSVSTHSPCVYVHKVCKWSEWYDKTNPTEHPGDYETSDELRKKGIPVCKTPIDVECKAKKYPYATVGDLGQTIQCNTSGFRCSNKDQNPPGCFIYKARYLCCSYEPCTEPLAADCILAQKTEFYTYWFEPPNQTDVPGEMERMPYITAEGNQDCTTPKKVECRPVENPDTLMNEMAPKMTCDESNGPQCYTNDHEKTPCRNYQVRFSCYTYNFSSCQTWQPSTSTRTTTSTSISSSAPAVHTASSRTTSTQSSASSTTSAPSTRMSSTPANTKFTTTTNLPAASTTISPPRYISTRSTLAVTTPVTIAISSSVSTHSPCVYVHKVCKWSEWYDKTNPTEHPGDYETSDELRKKGIPVCKTPIDVECKAKKYPYATVGDLGQTIQCNTSGFRCSNKDQNPPGCFIYKARYLCCSYEPCTEPLAADCILAQKTEFYTYWFEPPNQTDVPGEMERMPYITAEGNQDCTTPKKVECRPVENPDTPMNEMAPKMTCDESNGPQCYTNDHEKTPCRNYQVRFSCYTYNFSSCQTWQPSTSTRTTTSTSISSSAPAVHTASSRTTSTQSSASSTTSAPSTRMSSTPANTKFTTTTNLPAASTTISPPRYISTRSTLAVTTPVTIAISSSVSTHSPCVYVHKVCKWSEWYDKTNPTEHPGDYETSDELRKKGIPVCKTPIDVECKAKKYPYATVGDLGQTIQCNTSGFRCSNKDQNPPGCFIYKARYLCCSYEPCTEPLAADCILAQKTEFYTYWFEPPNQTDVPGEMERMPYITAEGNQDCTTPKKVECRPVENPDTPMNEMAPKMTCDESNGPQCYTNDHEKTPCRNYQVRFSCYTYNFSSCQTWQPSTSTRTTTSTSISSSAPAVHTASSRTTSTQSSASSTTSAPSTRMSSTPANTKFTTTTNLPAASTTISPPRYISTRSTLAVTTPVTIAISSSVSTHSPCVYVHKVCKWSEWYDKTNPTEHPGDYETSDELRKKGIPVCKTPIDVECKAKKYPYATVGDLGQTIQCNTSGFRCSNKDQNPPGCFIYKARYLCCSYEPCTEPLAADCILAQKTEFYTYWFEPPNQTDVPGEMERMPYITAEGNQDCTTPKKVECRPVENPDTPMNEMAPKMTCDESNGPQCYTNDHEKTPCRNYQVRFSCYTYNFSSCQTWQPSTSTRTTTSTSISSSAPAVHTASSRTTSTQSSASSTTSAPSTRMSSTPANTKFTTTTNLPAASTTISPPRYISTRSTLAVTTPVTIAISSSVSTHSPCVYVHKVCKWSEWYDKTNPTEHPGDYETSDELRKKGIPVCKTPIDVECKAKKYPYAAVGDLGQTIQCNTSGFRCSNKDQNPPGCFIYKARYLCCSYEPCTEPLAADCILAQKTEFYTYWFEPPNQTDVPGEMERMPYITAEGNQDCTTPKKVECRPVENPDTPMNEMAPKMTCDESNGPQCYTNDHEKTPCRNYQVRFSCYTYNFSSCQTWQPSTSTRTTTSTSISSSAPAVHTASSRTTSTQSSASSTTSAPSTRMSSTPANTKFTTTTNLPAASTTISPPRYISTRSTLAVTTPVTIAISSSVSTHSPCVYVHKVCKWSEWYDKTNPTEHPGDYETSDELRKKGIPVCKTPIDVECKAKKYPYAAVGDLGQTTQCNTSGFRCSNKDQNPPGCFIYKARYLCCSYEPCTEPLAADCILAQKTEFYTYWFEPPNQTDVPGEMERMPYITAEGNQDCTTPKKVECRPVENPDTPMNEMAPKMTCDESNGPQCYTNDHEKTPCRNYQVRFSCYTYNFSSCQTWQPSTSTRTTTSTSISSSAPAVHTASSRTTSTQSSASSTTSAPSTRMSSTPANTKFTTTTNLPAASTTISPPRYISTRSTLAVTTPVTIAISSSVSTHSPCVYVHKVCKWSEWYDKTNPTEHPGDYETSDELRKKGIPVCKTPIDVECKAKKYPYAAVGDLGQTIQCNTSGFRCSNKDQNPPGCFIYKARYLCCSYEPCTEPLAADCILAQKTEFYTYWFEPPNQTDVPGEMERMPYITAEGNQDCTTPKKVECRPVENPDTPMNEMAPKMTCDESNGPQCYTNDHEKTPCRNYQVRFSCYTYNFSSCQTWQPSTSTRTTTSTSISSSAPAVHTASSRTTSTQSSASSTTSAPSTRMSSTPANTKFTTSTNLPAASTTISPPRYISTRSTLAVTTPVTIAISSSVSTHSPCVYVHKVCKWSEWYDKTNPTEHPGDYETSDELRKKGIPVCKTPIDVECKAKKYPYAAVGDLGQTTQCNTSGFRCSNKDQNPPGCFIYKARYLCCSYEPCTEPLAADCILAQKTEFYTYWFEPPNQTDVPGEMERMPYITAEGNQDCTTPKKVECRPVENPDTPMNEMAPKMTCDESNGPQCYTNDHEKTPCRNYQVRFSCYTYNFSSCQTWQPSTSTRTTTSTSISSSAPAVHTASSRTTSTQSSASSTTSAPSTRMSSTPANTKFTTTTNLPAASTTISPPRYISTRSTLAVTTPVTIAISSSVSTHSPCVYVHKVCKWSEWYDKTNPTEHPGDYETSDELRKKGIPVCKTPIDVECKAKKYPYAAVGDLGQTIQCNTSGFRCSNKDQNPPGCFIYKARYLCCSYEPCTEPLAADCILAQKTEFYTYWFEPPNQTDVPGEMERMPYITAEGNQDCTTPKKVECRPVENPDTPMNEMAPKMTCDESNGPQCYTNDHEKTPCRNYQVRFSCYTYNFSSCQTWQPSTSTRTTTSTSISSSAPAVHTASSRTTSTQSSASSTTSAPSTRMSSTPANTKFTTTTNLPAASTTISPPRYISTRSTLAVTTPVTIAISSSVSTHSPCVYVHKVCKWSEWYDKTNPTEHPGDYETSDELRKKGIPVCKTPIDVECKAKKYPYAAVGDLGQTIQCNTSGFRCSNKDQNPPGCFIYKARYLCCSYEPCTEPLAADCILAQKTEFYTYWFEPPNQTDVPGEMERMPYITAEGNQDCTTPKKVECRPVENPDTLMNEMAPKMTCDESNGPQCYTNDHEKTPCRNYQVRFSCYTYNFSSCQTWQPSTSTRTTTSTSISSSAPAVHTASSRTTSTQSSASSTTSAPSTRMSSTPANTKFTTTTNLPAASTTISPPRYISTRSTLAVTTPVTIAISSSVSTHSPCVYVHKVCKWSEWYDKTNPTEHPGDYETSDELRKKGIPVCKTPIDVECKAKKYPYAAVGDLGQTIQCNTSGFRCSNKDQNPPGCFIYKARYLCCSYEPCTEPLAADCILAQKTEFYTYWFEPPNQTDVPGEMERMPYITAEGNQDCTTPKKVECRPVENPDTPMNEMAPKMTCDESNGPQCYTNDHEKTPCRNYQVRFSCYTYNFSSCQTWQPSTSTRTTTSTSISSSAPAVHTASSRTTSTQSSASSTTSAPSTRMSSTPANTKFTTTTNLPAASTTISPPRYISTRSTLAVTTPVTIAISSSVSTHSPCVYVHKVCKWSEWYDKTNPTEHPGDYETSDELRKKGIPVCKTPIDVECKAKKYPYAAVGDLGQTIQCNTSGFRCSNKDQNPPGCFIYKARYLCCSYEPCTEPLAADCILAQKTEFYTYWFEPPNQTDVPGEMERMPYITAEGNQDCTTPKKVECRPVENPDTPMNEMAPKMTCDESNGPQCYTNDHEKTPCRNYQVRFSCYTYNFSSCQTWQPSTSTRTTTSTSISSSAPAVHTASSRTTSTQSSASSTTSAPSTRMSSTPANTKFTTTTNLPAASTTISPPRYISTRSTLAVTTPVTIAISSSVSTHSPCVYVHKVCKWSEWYDKTNPTEHPGDYETSDELRKKGIPVCKTPIDVECKAKKYPYAAVGDLGQTIQCNTSGFRCSNKDQNPPGCFIYKARYLCCSYEPCTEPLAADCILAQKTEFYTYWFEPPNQTDVPGEMERMPYITAEGNQDCTTPKKVECRPVENPDTPMNEMAPKMTCDESNGPQCYTNDHEKTPCRNYQVRFSCYTYNFSSCQTWQPSTSTRTTTSTSISSSAPAVHTASSRTTSTQSSASSTTSAPSTRMSSTPANTKFTTTTNLPAASTTISPPRYISTRSTLAVTTPVTIAISSSVSTHSPCVYVHKVCKWSEWYDKTNPTEHPGDYETSDELRKKGIPVCKTPIDVECKAKKYPYAAVGDLGQTIQCNTSGFRCSNKDQNPPGCFIYKARYLCCSYEPCTEPLAADCILAQKTEFYTYWFEPPNQTDVPGEMERMPYITAEGNQDCTTPKKVECRPVENPDTPMNEMAPKMTCDESNGPQCYTNDHEKTPCRNYQVRFSCYTYNFSSCQTWQPSTSTRTTTSTSISSSGDLESTTVSLYATSTPTSKDISGITYTVPLSIGNTTLSHRTTQYWSPTKPENITCPCIMEGIRYNPEEIMSNWTDDVGCGVYTICGNDCRIQRYLAECPYHCGHVDPPREMNEIWQIDNCASATCLEDSTIRIDTVSCPPVENITCESGLLPKQVFTEGGCCFHYECEFCTGPDGKDRMPGETWTSHCQLCYCDMETIRVTCAPVDCEEPTAPTCDQEGFELVDSPMPDNPCCTRKTCRCDYRLCRNNTETCLAGFKLVMNLPAGDCCPTFLCEPEAVCLVNETIYQPGRPINMPADSCQECYCTHEMNPETKLNRVDCRPIICKTQCPLGYEYQRKAARCCGECVQVACTVTIGETTQVLQHKEEWHPEGLKCTHYTCDKDINGLFVVCVTNRTCPTHIPKDCESGVIEIQYDECCKIPVCAQYAPCKTQPKVTRIGHGDCWTTVDMSYCEGACGSSSLFSSMKGEMEQKCTCCQELTSSQKKVQLACPGGTSIDYTYTSVEECGCIGTPCAPE